jgi:hypothetical protein
MDLTEALLEFNKNNMEQKGKWFNSSSNPQELALTIRGMLALYIPFVLQIGTVFGWGWTESQLNEWLTVGSFIVAAGMILVGLGRKTYAWFVK